MKTTIFGAALSLALVFSVVSKADNVQTQTQGIQSQDIPVLYNANGTKFQVVTKVGQEFYPVFVAPAGKAFYKIAEKKYDLDLKAASTELSYTDGKMAPVTLPMGYNSKEEAEAKTVLLSGHKSDAKTQTICWGRWGYYGGCGYSYYRTSYYYYPTYYYQPYYYGYGYNSYNSCGYGGCYYNPCNYYYSSWGYCINGCW